MTLHVHRSARADRLVAALAGVLADPLEDPFRAEVVSVPTSGVERWVSQQLSSGLGATPGRHDGVCANVEFPFPATLVGVALAGAGSDDGGIWRPAALVWPLLETVEAAIDEDWLAPMSRVCRSQAGDATDRRFRAVRHMADLFDRYGVHRPAMVAAWAAGADVDGVGAPLPPDAAWQAELWRRLRARLGFPAPAERLGQACAALAADPGSVDLPRRLSVFGVTRVPALHVRVLRALAVGRDVHLFALHPSAPLWAAVDGVAPRSPLPRREDASAGLAVHPLLASWARDVRELQLVLAATDGAATDGTGAGPAGPGMADHEYPVDDPPATLLGRIQADLRANRHPGGVAPGAADTRPWLAADDDSIAVHSCHGRTRQVEVLRDAVLHRLAGDPTLEPRDVIVMCPDIDAFAPLIHAAFGAGVDADDPGGAGPGGRPVDVRVRLADRSIRQTNPLLAVVDELLQLGTGRVTATQLLDLAGRAPVRRRFHLDDDDLARLERWVADAGVRWGLDAPHRAPYGLDALDANTWRAGLDRILLGAAMSEDGLPLVGGVLPLDDVDSGDLDLAGRLAELVARLGTALDRLGSPQSVASWTDALAAGAAALTATSDTDAWQAHELARLLDGVVEETGGRTGTVLSPPEVRALLADRLRGRPTRANFRTGHLTVCTLVPMRSVPHRVVCLLGLDDGVFPRQGGVDGDDLIAVTPCVGDRDPRSEDRQLLLDAVLAAGDAVVVTFNGRDERTNAPLPPSVPLAELLDVVDATVRARDDTGAPVAARDRVLRVHPLQPFDPRNFAAAGPWSFDGVHLEGARALLAPRSTAVTFLPGRLDDAPVSTVEVDELIRFFSHPVRAFLRSRLGVSLRADADDIADDLPIGLDALERWKVGDRLLQARLAGADAASALAAETVRGGLPPGPMGEAILAAVGPKVEALVARAGPTRAAGALDVEIDVAGVRIAGTVPGIDGDEVRSVSYSAVRARQRLTAWIRLLVLTAADADRAWRTVTIGPSPGGPRTHLTGPLAGDAAGRGAAARGHLADLVDIYRRGLREPLPLFLKTSAAYAGAHGDPTAGDPLVAARRQWETDRWSQPQIPGEQDDAEHRLVLGGVVGLEAVVSAGPADDEDGPAWPADPTRFGRYARRLWGPVAAHEGMRS